MWKIKKRKIGRILSVPWDSKDLITFYERNPTPTWNLWHLKMQRSLAEKGNPLWANIRLPAGQHQALQVFNKPSCSRHGIVAIGRKLLYHVSPGAVLPRSFINRFPNRFQHSPGGHHIYGQVSLFRFDLICSYLQAPFIPISALQPTVAKLPR